MNNSSSNISSGLAEIPYGLLLYWKVFYENLANSINFYFLAVAIPFGCLTNLLSFIVFCRKRLNNDSNIGFYNQCFCMSNFITMLFSLLMYSGLFFPFDFNTDSDWSCQFIMYSRKTIRELSPLLELFFTLDRFFRVCSPRKMLFLKKKLNIFIIICIMLASMLAANFANAFFYVKETRSVYLNDLNQSKVLIQKSCVANMTYTLISDFVLCFLRCFFPMIAMTILSILTIRKLNESSKVRTKITTETKKVNKDNQFTRSLIIVNLFFVIFNFPLAFIYVVKDIYFYAASANYTYIIINFLWAMSFNLATLHYLSFFFLNYLFNHRFRSEVKTLLFGGIFKKFDANTTTMISKNQVNTDSIFTDAQTIKKIFNSNY